MLKRMSMQYQSYFAHLLLLVIQICRDDVALQVFLLSDNNKKSV